MKSKGFTHTPTLASLRVILKNIVLQSVFLSENKYGTQTVRAVKTMPKLVSGFTLIELLIVIAIIGILASVVLGSLNTARTKATDAAIKSNLTNMRGQANIWYDDNAYVYAASGNEYASSTCPTTASTGNIFADAKIFEGVSSAYDRAGGVALSRCVASVDTWAIAIQLKSSDGFAGTEPDAWCVDSIGSSRSYTYVDPETITNGPISVTDACK